MSSGGIIIVVDHYRVSTKKQGMSGYGIDAQKETVASYLKCGNNVLIDEFTEVESGEKNDRVELEKSIRTCRLKNAKLIVSKLDRLSRDVAFVASLMNSGIKFVVAEMPEMNELTCHIFSAIGQHERKVLSDRTKKALAQVKKRGVILGNPCFKDGRQIVGSGNTKRALEVKNNNCKQFRSLIREVIEDIRVQNGKKLSLQSLANILNDRGFRTIRNRPFTKMTIKAIIK